MCSIRTSFLTIKRIRNWATQLIDISKWPESYTHTIMRTGTIIGYFNPVIPTKISLSPIIPTAFIGKSRCRPQFCLKTNWAFQWVHFSSQHWCCGLCSPRIRLLSANLSGTAMRITRTFSTFTCIFSVNFRHRLQSRISVLLCTISRIPTSKIANSRVPLTISIPNLAASQIPGSRF